MIIQMTTQMSGGRYDDRSWPMPWHDFEVPDDEGRGLIRCGAAMEVVGTTVEPEPERAVPDSPVPDKPAPVIELAPEKDPPLPTNADPKAAWVEYAVSRGSPPEEAEQQTKAQLQAVYGGRL